MELIMAIWSSTLLCLVVLALAINEYEKRESEKALEEHWESVQKMLNCGTLEVHTNKEKNV